MQLTTQVAARNTRKQVVVLSSDAKGSEFVEWQAAEDPNGMDVQIVPETIASSVPFIRLVQKGIIEIENPEDNPGLTEAIDRQRAAFERRTSGAAAQAASAIEKTADNDILSVPCIGPDSRGQGKCGEPVNVRSKTKDEKPPLCNQHLGLASQYVPDERQEGTTSVKTWVRFTMGAPERQQP